MGTSTRKGVAYYRIGALSIRVGRFSMGFLYGICDGSFRGGGRVGKFRTFWVLGLCGALGLKGLKIFRAVVFGVSGFVV